MKTKQLLIMAIVALVVLTSCGGGSKKADLSYAPWPDLSAHFDLEKVTHVKGNNMLTFNSYEISQGKVPITSDRLENSEYSAMILGTGVWVRTQPLVAGKTKDFQVGTGNEFYVTRHNFYANGRYWCYGFVMSGPFFDHYGYVCSDFIVSSDQYAMVQKYLFQRGSNLNYKSDSKILRAAADVLLKLQADKRHPNLYVSMLNQYPFGQHTIVTYQIRDLNLQSNNCMLAVVQFFNANNDFVVLGIVPGNVVNQIQPNANGSYDVYFN